MAISESLINVKWVRMCDEIESTAKSSENEIKSITFDRVKTKSGIRFRCVSQFN